MKLRIVTLLAVMTPSFCWAEANSVFFQETYNYAVSSSTIRKAAQCEALDELIYSRKLNNYEAQAIAKLVFDEKVTHKSNQFLEQRLAFNSVKNYYLGRFYAMKELVFKNNEPLKKISLELQCDKFSKE